MAKEVLKVAGALGLSALFLVVFATWVSADIEAPALLSPQNGENLGDNMPIFKWQGPTLPLDNKYRLVISKNENFSENVYDNGNIPGENNLPGNIFQIKIENQLPDGLYYWKVASENNRQSPPENWSEVRTFRVDTLPPSPPVLLSPLDGENENDSTPLLSWQAPSENSFPLTYRLQLSTSQDFLPGTILVDDNTLTGTSWEAPLLQDNLYYWKVAARDNAGNWGSFSSPRSFRVDTVADAPQNVKVSPSGWTASTSFTVEWTNPPEGSRIDGAYYKVDAPPTSDNDGTWVSGAGITSLPVSVSGDGEHTIYVWLKDNAGNVDNAKRASVKVYVDTTPPSTPTISSLTHAQGVPTRSSSPAFSWNAVGGPSPVTYGYKLEGYDTDWKSTTSLSVSYSGVPDGTYTFYLGAREATGQVSGTATYTIVIDTTPPTITLTGLAAGATETPSGWMLTTSESVFTLTGRVGVGSTVTINGIGVPVSGGLFSQTYTLSVGQNRFVIRVVDEAGNISERTLFVEYTGGGAGAGGVGGAPAPGVPGFAIFLAALLALIFVGAIVLLRLR